jgi:hypothetical protein
MPDKHKPAIIAVNANTEQSQREIDPSIDCLINNLFAAMAARAPRRPSSLNNHRVTAAPDCERLTLQFGRMRQRWKKREPVPRDTKTFATILQKHGVRVFSVQSGYIECQAAQTRIAKALGS